MLFIPWVLRCFRGFEKTVITMELISTSILKLTRFMQFLRTHFYLLSYLCPSFGISQFSSPSLQYPGKQKFGSMCKNLEIYFMGSFIHYLTYIRPQLSKCTKIAPQGKTSQGGMWPQHRQEEQWPSQPECSPQALQGWWPFKFLSTGWAR